MKTSLQALSGLVVAGEQERDEKVVYSKAVTSVEKMAEWSGKQMEKSLVVHSDD